MMCTVMEVPKGYAVPTGAVQLAKTSGSHSIKLQQSSLVGALVYPCRLSGYVSRLAIVVISVARQMSLRPGQGPLMGRRILYLSETFATFPHPSPPFRHPKTCIKDLCTYDLYGPVRFCF
jgi:hypothetical protein